MEFLYNSLIQLVFEKLKTPLKEWGLREVENNEFESANLQTFCLDVSSQMNFEFYEFTRIQS